MGVRPRPGYGRSMPSTETRSRRPTPARRRPDPRIGPAFIVAIAAASLAALIVVGGPALVRSATETRGSLPACRIADEPAEHASLADWDRTLLDPERTLGRTYAPDDLVATEEAGIAGGGSVRAFVILDLASLARAAERVRARAVRYLRVPELRRAGSDLHEPRARLRPRVRARIPPRGRVTRSTSSGPRSTSTAAAPGSSSTRSSMASSSATRRSAARHSPATSRSRGISDMSVARRRQRSRRAA